MSNRVTIQVCKFVNYGTNRAPQDETWGYRIYDDYGTDYNNNYETLEDVFDELNPDTILEFIEEKHDNFYESVLYLGGLFLCDDWIDVTEQMSDDQRKRIDTLRGMGTI
jgi:hypothetical protein